MAYLVIVSFVLGGLVVYLIDRSRLWEVSDE